MNHLVTGGARRSPSGTPAVPSSLSLPAAIAHQGVGQPEWTARLHQASALRGPGGPGQSAQPGGRGRAATGPGRLAVWLFHSLSGSAAVNTARDTEVGAEGRQVWCCPGKNTLKRVVVNILGGAGGFSWYPSLLSFMFASFH